MASSLVSSDASYESYTDTTATPNEALALDDDGNDSDGSGSSEESGSLAGSLSTTDAIDLADGNLLGADKLIELSSQIPELAIATLSLANNNLVDPEVVQMYNDDSHSNRGILTFAGALAEHKTITSLDISVNNLGVKGQSGIVALAKAVQSGFLKSLDMSNNQILGMKNVRDGGEGGVVGEEERVPPVPV
jgi:hypothetical protein